MRSIFQNKFSINAVTSLIWLTTIGTGLYWASLLLAERKTPGYAPVVPPVVSIDSQAVARLMGSVNTPTAEKSSVTERLKLLGVVAAELGAGAALISIDGKPAKPFRVGNAVEEGLYLRSAIGRQATLSTEQDQSVLFTLDMVPIEKQNQSATMRRPIKQFGEE